MPEDIGPYYKDLQEKDLVTRLALVHQRFSTNTMPTWELAQPFRHMCQNGEINTLRGKSDSASMDMVVELLTHTGRSLPEIMMMMIPEAWEKHATMTKERKAFYEYNGCIMEPWDGPASVPFTDDRQCRKLRIQNPVISNADLEKIRNIDIESFKAETIEILYPKAQGLNGLEDALDAIVVQVEKAIEKKNNIIILSDRGVNQELAPIPALLACSFVNHQLNRLRKRSYFDIIIESAEPREPHHFATLFGYGASAVNPYMVNEIIRTQVKEGFITGIDEQGAVDNFNKAIGKGILKVMNKIGISTLHSYRGSQIFEIVGFNSQFVEKYFPYTASRIEGIGLYEIEKEIDQRYKQAYPDNQIDKNLGLNVGGDYRWRRNGERHLFNPTTVAKLQQAVRLSDQASYDVYAKAINEQAENLMTIRGLFQFDNLDPIPLDEVEPWTDIVKRFKTGAMSYGSISREAHENLAIAMNRIGGKSNSGEGGEDRKRFQKDINGDSRNSAIKQVASGRFGVTSHYLTNAKEIQIKMAQGAKPGEGGQLPGYKVLPWIANARNSTPFVGLISPPPHHDIYSIEDLAQLIYDLKNANREARINVKLVSEVGVGTIAAGVAKAKADVVLIAGYDGGTGASPLTSLKHAGLPWELGLAEAQQTLVMNNLRSRIVVECDGQLKTGRDVAIAALLGAEEFGFATAPLVASGCIMMRKCHLNTCPVGIATQDKELRKNFKGTPEHILTTWCIKENGKKLRGYYILPIIFQNLLGAYALLHVNNHVRYASWTIFNSLGNLRRKRSCK
eukprot:maker-scaffold2028_size22368-snap-gene-0.0 protein:Tk09015 transcript:maker-scaffold2028_size22368-snap-gene-0.0-mRNA-1 annotation:"glutamate synthase"